MAQTKAEQEKHAKLAEEATKLRATATELWDKVDKALQRRAEQTKQASEQANTELEKANKAAEAAEEAVLVANKAVEDAEKTVEDAKQTVKDQETAVAKAQEAVKNADASGKKAAGMALGEAKNALEAAKRVDTEAKASLTLSQDAAKKAKEKVDPAKELAKKAKETAEKAEKAAEEAKEAADKDQAEAVKAEAAAEAAEKAAKDAGPKEQIKMSDSAKAAIALFNKAHEDNKINTNVGENTLLEIACGTVKSEHRIEGDDMVAKRNRKNLLRVADANGRNLSHYAAIVGQFNLLTNTTLHQLDAEGNSPAHYAAYNKSLKLDKVKFDVDAKNKAGQSAREVAFDSSNFNFVDHFGPVKKGFSPNDFFFEAAVKGNLEAFNHYNKIDKKTSTELKSLVLNHRDADDKTLLHHAVINHQYKFVQFLLSHEGLVNVNATDKLGNTALHYAAINGDKRPELAEADRSDENTHEKHHMIELLVRAQADRNVKNNAGKTAFDLGVDNGHNNLVKAAIGYKNFKQEQRAKVVKGESLSKSNDKLYESDDAKTLLNTADLDQLKKAIDKDVADEKAKNYADSKVALGRAQNHSIAMAKTLDGYGYTGYFGNNAERTNKFQESLKLLSKEPEAAKQDKKDDKKLDVKDEKDTGIVSSFFGWFSTADTAEEAKAKEDAKATKEKAKEDLAKSQLAERGNFAKAPYSTLYGKVKSLRKDIKNDIFEGKVKRPNGTLLSLTNHMDAKLHEAEERHITLSK